MIANAKEPKTHKKAKHIQRNYHLIRDFVEKGDVVITKIASTNDLADLFTKSLTFRAFGRHVKNMRVKCMSTWL